MPKVDDTPAALKPYKFHGVDLSWDDPNGQAVGECPWCGKDGKFSVGCGEGVWRCWSCQAGSDKGGGNALTFLRLLWSRSKCLGEPALKLARDRNLLQAGTLEAWGAVVSCVTGEWLLPGYNRDGKLVQLYKYVRSRGSDKDGGKARTLLMPTPGLDRAEQDGYGHGLFRPGAEWAGGVRNTVYVCEGPWDGMPLWEVMRCAKLSGGAEGVDSYVFGGGGLLFTGNINVSLAATSTVLAVPGAGIFQDRWSTLLAGRRVVLCYDKDDAGRAGARRVAGLLGGLRSEESPSELLWVNWPGSGNIGFDVRDLLSEWGTAPERVVGLSTLLRTVEPVPADWVGGRAKGAKPGGTEVEVLPCKSWVELRTQWRKAMNWVPGLEHGLTCMLATCLSTARQGDQLWIKLVGPPSCGKSVLCEAISTAKKYVKAKSTIRGLFSGYQVDKEGSEDVSLAPALRNMTLVTKDGDTLLQMPNLPQILAEFRDVYDRVSRTQYRNKMSRDHEGLNMTWVLAGTEALRLLDSSELGERMLDVVMFTTMDEEVERSIAMQKAYQAKRDLGHVYDGKPESRDPPDMVRAKQLTGGYVCWLRDNASDLLAAVDMPEGYYARCCDLGEFVSFMRSRPSKRQDEAVQRELSFRLVSQMVRLANCLAVVLQKTSVDEQVMQRVTQVALDTARGRTLEIARRMHDAGLEGCSPESFPVWLALDEVKVGAYLKHMRGIGAVEKFREEVRGVKGRYRYRLTPRLSRLYAEVYHGT